MIQKIAEVSHNQMDLSDKILSLRKDKGRQKTTVHVISSQLRDAKARKAFAT